MNAIIEDAEIEFEFKGAWYIYWERDREVYLYKRGVRGMEGDTYGLYYLYPSDHAELYAATRMWAVTNHGMTLTEFLEKVLE
jgi:hypothetical protein